MTSRFPLKTFTIATLTTLLFAAAGPGHANPVEDTAAGLPQLSVKPGDARACARARMPAPRATAPAAPDDAALMAETMARFAAIEQAQREGRITAYEAGRLMRWQWDIARFRQGFRDGMQVTPPTPAPASTDGDACVDPLKELASALAPLGGLAVNGMQAGMRNAAGMMRALTREVGKLLAEEDVRAHGMAL
jgi:hypothetical protein